MIEIYKGIYRDNLGTREIVITNDYQTLTTEIDGVIFSGSDFDELSVDDKSKYTDAQLTRFTFLKTPIYESKNLLETLCDCLFETVIPQVIIDKVNNIQFDAELKIEIILGHPRSERPGHGIEFEYVTLSLEIAGKIYTGRSDLFESALDGIRNQIEDRYHLKNCYGCMYGDYSVYGQACFGSMHCFRNQKAEYRKVTNKEEYMELGSPDMFVQEIYCCDQFEIRSRGAGYRG
jgi:hypothetical protein